MVVHHKKKEPKEKDEKKESKPGKIQEKAETFIYCDAEDCRYYHECFFDTKEKKFVMPDGHYCANNEWIAHVDANDTEMLVQDSSVTPEGTDLREAFGGGEGGNKNVDTHGTDH